MAVVIALRNRHKTEVVIHTCIVLCPFKIALLSHNKRDNRNRFLGTGIARVDIGVSVLEYYSTIV